jgi:hypothetical protein
MPSLAASVLNSVTTVSGMTISATASGTCAFTRRIASSWIIVLPRPKLANSARRPPSTSHLTSTG